MAESASSGTYNGAIPVADLYIGHMLDGGERRGQGSDYVHEFMRLGSAENRDKMSQSQSLGYRLAVESGSGLTRRESNKYVEA